MKHDIFSLANAVIEVLSILNYNQIAILYTTNEVQFCDGAVSDFEVVLSLTYHHEASVKVRVAI